MTRLRIDLPEELYGRVGDLARAERTTREKVILDAIQAYVPSRRVVAGTGDAFGLWSEQVSTIDAYIKSIRSEWGDEAI